jgi:hypothetical protein
MATLTAELPNDSGLRAAAYQLRTAGDTLGAQASVTRGVADSIGPPWWEDDASGTAKALLRELADELGTGSSAMYQSADALETLAGYVSSQRWRYDETGRELAALERDPFGDIVHAKLAEAARLLEERSGIEWHVRAAMGQAGEVINQAAALATWYHGSAGTSIWSRIGHYISDFGSGAWDGTYALGKTVFGFAVTAAKLSTYRLMVDPAGYLHDAEHALKTTETTIDTIAHHKKQFAENLINLKELRSDPVHWAGELVPTIILAVASAGVGLAGKGADTAGAVAETADSVDAATGAAGRLGITDLVNQQGFGVSRYENVFADELTPKGNPISGHTIEMHVNDSGNLSDADYLRSLGRRTDSIWTPPEAADEALKQFLLDHANDIDNLLANPASSPFVDTMSAGKPLGIAIHAGDPIIRVADTAKFVIRPASNMPEGFMVETAHLMFDSTAPRYLP